MKSILIFSLVCFTFCVWGPADKIANSNSNSSCIPLPTFSSPPESLSECVDRRLNVLNNYFDRCCYVRYQYDGKMNSTCFPLKEEDYLDITESIREFEENFKSLYAEEDVDIEGKQCKVYQFDCSSSNIKFLFIASLLLALLF